MKYFFILLIVLLACSLGSQAQSSRIAFNQAANLFIEGQNQQALQRVNAGLRQHPNDAQLKALKEKLERQQEQQQQQEKEKEKEQEQQQSEGESEQPQEEKEQQQKDGESEQQEQEGKEGEEEKKEGGEKEKEGENGKEKKEGEGQEGEEEQQQPKPGLSETERRLQEMDISPEKARMILEAMKSNEVQYLQQKRRKSSRRSSSGRPDW